MDRRKLRGLRPSVERFESRALPSAITSIMASQPHAIHGRVPGGGQSIRFVPSTTSIAVPTNQGPQGTNLALVPTGNLTPHELRRERFVAAFIGPYSVGPGRTDTEAQQVHIRGAGGANTFLHGDIQIRIITPKDPSTQIGGVAAIFDRNLNSNTVLGFDLTAPQQDVDRAGRPNLLSPTIDVNESSGVYDEAFSQGTVSIRYIPSGKHTPGVIDQGTAIVKIRAQIYTTGVDFILANSDLNPGGPSQGGPRRKFPGG